jgi:hypothetical protein
MPVVWGPGGALAASTTADVPRLVREVRALEAEVAMAARPGLYFVLDMQRSRLLVKAAGLTLKVMPITALKVWGNPPTVRPHRVIEKSALLAPRRPTIRPPERSGETQGNGAADTSPARELDVLEVTDMPARFWMTLAHGLRVAVRPEPEGVISRIRESVGYVGWYVTRPLPTVWHRSRGWPYTAMYLRMAAADARALYWACADGADLLLIP